MVIWRIGSSPAGKGRVHMNKPKTHMTLDDRIAIQERLNNNLSVRAIAKNIYKSPSTVKREIDARKCPKGRRSITVLPNCANRKDCGVHGLCITTFANDIYQNTLISSREGINQDPEKL